MAAIRNIKNLLAGIAEFTATAVFYFAATCIGLIFAIPGGGASLVSPATAVGLLLAVRYGWAAAAGCGLAAVIADLAGMGGLSDGAQLSARIFPLLLMALVVFAQMQAGTMLLRRHALPMPDDASVFRLTGIVFLVAIPVALIRSIGITAIVTGFGLMSDVRPQILAITMALGDGLATLSIFPVALYLAESGWARIKVDRMFRRALLALAGIAVLGWVVSSSLAASEQAKRRAEFQLQSGEFIQAVKNKAADDYLLLNALRSLVDADSQLSRPEFADFASILLLARPQFDGIGLIRRVSDGERAAFEESRSKQLKTVFGIKTRAPQGGFELEAAHSGLYFPLDYAEPASTTPIANAEGFDLASDPQLAAAMDEAARTGQPTGSGPIEIVPDHPQDAGDLVLLPFHELPGQTSIDTVAGYVALRTEMRDFVSIVLKKSGRLMQKANIAIHDVTDRVPRSMVAVVEGRLDPVGTIAAATGYEAADEFDIEGRRWRVAASLSSAGVASLQTHASLWRVAAPQFLAAVVAGFLLLFIRQSRARNQMEMQIDAMSRRLLAAADADPSIPQQGNATLVASLASLPTDVDADAATEIENRRCRMIWEERLNRQCYEPVVDLKTGLIVGFESLMRFPKGTETPPIYRFIAWVERAGYIRALTRTSIKEALELIEVFQAVTGRHDVPFISVNVSATDLGADEFVDVVVAMTRQHRAACPRLKLELTESVLLVDIEQVVRRLQLLRSTGLRVALDDFGTGYASLSYLRQLPIDTIKLDHSFISRVGTDIAAREIVRALVTLAGKLSLDVIAEGLEDSQTTLAVVKLGCTMAQGYRFDRAAPAETVTEWVRGRKRFAVN